MGGKGSGTQPRAPLTCCKPSHQFFVPDIVAPETRCRTRFGRRCGRRYVERFGRRFGRLCAGVSTIPGCPKNSRIEPPKETVQRTVRDPGRKLDLQHASWPESDPNGNLAPPATDFLYMPPSTCPRLALTCDAQINGLMFKLPISCQWNRKGWKSVDEDGKSTPQKSRQINKYGHWWKSAEPARSRWGSRGPRFKSGQPDIKNPRGHRLRGFYLFRVRCHSRGFCKHIANIANPFGFRRVCAILVYDMGSMDWS